MVSGIIQFEAAGLAVMYATVFVVSVLRFSALFAVKVRQIRLCARARVQ